MRNILVILLFTFSFNLYSQNYHKSINLSGFDVSENDSFKIEAAIQNFIDSRPTELQNQFKVYDFGFYLFNEIQTGELNEENVWNNFKSQVTAPYYLIFGLNGNNNGEFNELKISLKLPETGDFECLDLLSPSLRLDIETQVYNVANSSYISENLTDLKLNAINYLNEIVNSKLCCDFNRTGPLCDGCLITDAFEINGLKYYSTRDIHQELIKKGFLIESVLITNDEEYHIPADESTIRNNRNSVGINATIQFRDGNEDDVDGIISDLQSSLDIESIHTFKFPRDCGLFQQTWETHNSDNNGSVFIALINVDRTNGFIAYHIKKGEHFNRNLRSGPNPTDEDLEGLIEARDEAGGACGNTLYAYLVKFDYHVDQFMANVTFNENDSKYYKSYYENKDKTTTAGLTQAKFTLGYYFDIEWLSEKKKNNRWDWTASVAASWNVCNEEIHGALDLCGVIEPIGIFCDATNAVIYGLQGDGKNCILSSAAILPIIGSGVTATKMGARVYKSVDVHLRFTFKTVGNAVHFVGGTEKLKKVMQKVAFSSNFAGVTRYVNQSLTEAHHLIPWELCKASGSQLNIFKKMSKMGWHAGDPWLNGLIIPKLCKDGITVFHTNHPKYTDWVSDALTKIDGISGDDVLINLAKLESHLITHLEKAWNANKSINVYFEELINLPNGKGLLDIKKL